MPGPLPPQAVEDDLQVLPRHTFEERVLKCIQCGLSFTWTALSPNPTRREPKRPPTEEPEQENVMERKRNYCSDLFPEAMVKPLLHGCQM